MEAARVTGDDWLHVLMLASVAPNLGGIGFSDEKGLLRAANRRTLLAAERVIH